MESHLDLDLIKARYDANSRVVGAALRLKTGLIALPALGASDDGRA